MNSSRNGTHGILELLLRAVSLDPSSVPSEAEVQGEKNRWNPSNALTALRREFPDFDSVIAGKRVMDFGCGDGFQSCALARSGAAYVLGVDIQEERLARARSRAHDFTNLEFAANPPRNAFDVAISLDAFEHFSEPDRVLAQMASAVKPGGVLLITFGPPWYAPYGGHMAFFTRLPWVHLIFPEQTVFEVRKLYRDDSMRSYSPGMNKMSVGRFERTVRTSGLAVERRRYHAVKGLFMLSKLPALRELFINQITCVLRKP